MKTLKIIQSMFKTKKQKQFRGELIRKEGATRAIIREQIETCNRCKGKNPQCPVCLGSGKVICENIVNIFPEL